jgi:hypothetical protein
MAVRWAALMASAVDDEPRAAQLATKVIDPSTNAAIVTRMAAKANASTDGWGFIVLVNGR